jgi:Zn-dependent peptidase ImmA (M78 family)
MKNKQNFHPAEELLLHLGVEHPLEIDLEAIAYYVGASVDYKALKGTEAFILGYGKKARILVSNKSSQQRQRFSIAHELGHWHYHRGKDLICKAEDIGPFISKPLQERQADSYASQLLLPDYLFKKEISQIKKPDFHQVISVARMFNTSLTATALKFVDINQWPIIILLVDSKLNVKWFSKDKDIPKRWYLKKQIEKESICYDIFRSTSKQCEDNILNSDAYFNVNDADCYRIEERICKLNQNEALVMLHLSDIRMFEEE